MKKTLLLIVCMMAALSVQAGQHLTAFIEREIRERAKQEWPDDYSMQSSEITQQKTAYQKFQGMSRPIEMSTSTFNAIKTRAEKEWPKDYSMQLYELKNQLKAWLELND